MISLPPVGSRVCFRVDHDVFPHCIVPDGTIGFVVQCDDSGLWVLPTSADFPALAAEWHGRVQFYDHGDDGVEAFGAIVAAALEVIPLSAPDRTLARHLAEIALDVAAKVIQDILGVESGDFAGVFFSDDATRATLQNYAENEIEFAGEVPL